MRIYSFHNIILRLAVEHLTVSAVKRHQLVVRTLLFYRALLEKVDPVSHPGRGQSVRDEDDRVILGILDEVLVKFILRDRIERGRRLVENRYRPVAGTCEDSRDRDLLALTA